MTKTTKLDERNKEMARLHTEEGMTFEAIGAEFGISRERARQVIRAQGVSRKDTLTSRLVDWACAFCGKTEKLTPSQADKRKYCDSKCASRSRYE